MSVKELKAELNALRVDYSDCTEKSELVARLEAARKVAASSGNTASSSDPCRPASSDTSSKPASYSRAPSYQDSSSQSTPSASSSDPCVVELRRILTLPATDYYGILDVTRDADADTLKKAYRKLALRLHPDKCSLRGADEGFKRVGAAFAVLSDSAQRRKFDFMGASSFNTSGGGGGGGTSAAGATFKSSVFGDQDAEELFRAFFGTGSASSSSGGARSSSTSVDLHPGDLLQRLAKAFAANPWTLITLLSGLASLANVIETLNTHFGGKAIAVVPSGAAGIYFCPHEYRRYALMAVAVVLFSGFI